MVEPAEKKEVQLGVRMASALKERIEAKAALEARSAADWARLVLEERLDSGVPAGRDAGALTEFQRRFVDAVQELPEPVQRALAGFAAKARHSPKLCAAVTALESVVPNQGTAAARSQRKGRTARARGKG